MTESTLDLEEEQEQRERLDPFDHFSTPKAHKSPEARHHLQPARLWVPQVQAESDVINASGPRAIARAFDY